MRTTSNRKRRQHQHQHAMSTPWTVDGHQVAICVILGCDYIERDGQPVNGQPAAPAAQQGALFDVWGAGIVPTPQDH